MKETQKLAELSQILEYFIILWEISIQNIKISMKETEASINYRSQKSIQITEEYRKTASCSAQKHAIFDDSQQHFDTDSYLAF